MLGGIGIAIVKPNRGVVIATTQNKAIDAKDLSFTEILRNIGSSAKDLIAEEGQLVKSEFKETLGDAVAELSRTVIFTGLVCLAVFPFLLFLVLGLGVLLEERYWLSSLIVAVVWGSLCGSIAYTYYRRLMAKDLSLPQARQAAEEVKDVIENNF